MKKITCFLLFLLIIGTTCTKAQSFEKGTKVMSLGIGLGSSLLNYSGSNQTPALSAQFEKGTWETRSGVISLGGYVGYKAYKYADKSLGYSEKWTYTIVGVRSSYHYTGLNLDKLDLYGGVMLSYNILKYKYTDDYGYSGNYNTGSYGSGAGFTGFLGGRYSFSKNIAVTAELGYGVSYLTLGLAFKF